MNLPNLKTRQKLFTDLANRSQEFVDYALNMCDGIPASNMGSELITLMPEVSNDDAKAQIEKHSEYMADMLAECIKMRAGNLSISADTLNGYSIRLRAIQSGLESIAQDCDKEDQGRLVLSLIPVAAMNRVMHKDGEAALNKRKSRKTKFAMDFAKELKFVSQHFGA